MTPYKFLGMSILLLVGGAASGQSAHPPAIVPPGWTTHPVPGDRTMIRYASPDGRAVLTLRDISVGPEGAGRAIYGVSHRPDESVTYEQRGRSWIVVSGYRGGEIYYRRANLACNGTRWHVIDLTYPGSEKLRMDATVTYISHRLDRYRSVCPAR